MKTKFKVGDRVMSWEFVGLKEMVCQKGKILDIIGDDMALVEFDNFIDGHSSCCNSIQKGKYGHCWVCKIDKLHKEGRPDQLIFRDNATILFYDGKKYVSKCCEGDTYDKEKGLLMCLAKAHGHSFMEIQEMLAGAEYQGRFASNRLDTSPLNSKFSVGDYVRITNAGTIYRTYEEWFDRYAPKLKDQYIANRYDNICDMDGYKVVAVGKHESLDRVLCAIQDEYGNVYLYDERGLKLTTIRKRKRKAKEDEWIKVTNADDRRYNNGDIMRVWGTDEDGVFAYRNGNENDSFYIYDREYTVLENYKDCN